VEEDRGREQPSRKTPFLQNELPQENAAVAEPAGRSSGPRTRAGKQRSKLNAITHGVFAQTPVLPLVENEDDWLRLRQDVIDWFQLDGEFQESLGERVAMLIWRLKRVNRMETEAIRHYQQDVPEDWRASMQMVGMPIPDRRSKERVEEEYRMLMARLLPGEDVMDKVLRYESRLHRYLLQMMYMIMVMKGLIAGTAKFHGTPQVKSPGVSRPKDPPALLDPDERQF
jgi:hypothetical protein